MTRYPPCPEQPYNEPATIWGQLIAMTGPNPDNFRGEPDWGSYRQIIDNWPDDEKSLDQPEIPLDTL